MAGFESLGNLLGGGIDREGAFQQGRFRTAQTEQALASATKAQQDAIRQQAENEAIAQLKANTPNFAAPTDQDLAALIIGGLGTQYSSANEGRLRGQEFTNRATAADPSASALLRTRALQSVSGKPGSDIEAVGSRGYVNLTDETQTPQPLGDAFTTPPELSTAVKNFNFAQTLPPEQRENFNRYVRQDQIVTAGGVPYAVGLNAPAGAPAPIVAPTDVANNKGLQAGAVQGAKDTAKAAADLPDKLASIQKFEADIDALLDSPGFDTAYGLSSVLDPRNLIPGTDAKEANILREKIGAESFGVSVQTLRGLGQLSNAEGAKVQKAYTEATETGLSEQTARKKFAALKRELKAARERAIERVNRGVRVTPDGKEIADTGAAANASPSTNAQGWKLMVDAQGNKAYVSPDGKSFEEIQ